MDKDTSFILFTAQPSYLAAIYFSLLEAVWIFGILLVAPDIRWMSLACASSMLIFLMLLAHFVCGFPGRERTLFYTAAGWFMANDNSPLSSVRNRIELLPGSIVFPHVIVFKYRCIDGTKAQYLFWLDGLGESSFRALSRLIKQSAS